MILLKLLGVLLAGVALAGVGIALEKALKRPGLAHVLASVCLAVVGIYLLADGQRLLPLLFIAQSIGFVFHARWRRSLARADGLATREA
jgi:sulfite exporter TauE/SafE